MTFSNVGNVESTKSTQQGAEQMNKQPDSSSQQGVKPVETTDGEQYLNVNGLTLFGSHTTAHKVSIEREKFKPIQVSDLNKLSAEKVFEKIEEKIN